MGWTERIKIKKNRFLIKVRNSFRGQRKKELLTFVVFLFISSFFWLLQWMKEDIETEFVIPIEIVNVPRNILLTSDLPTGLNINVKDKGATILSYYFSRPMPTLQINFKELKLNRGVATISAYKMIAQLRKKFVPSLEIMSIIPESISMNFSHGESKSIPITLLTSINTAKSSGISGCYYASPSAVTVYAPADKLKEISRIYSDVLRIEDAKDTIKAKVRLQKIEGVRFIPDEVTVMIPIEPFTEKKLEVPVEGTGAPAGFTMRIFPVKVTLVCYVAISKYEKVQASDFKLGVDFSNMNKNSDTEYPIKLLKWPKNASKIRFQPSDVEVLMEESR